MNLGEAVAKREHGEVITRNNHNFILPTDDEDNRMIVMFKQSNNDWKVIRRWNPQYEDFDSDMWKIERLEDVIVENTDELQDKEETDTDNPLSREIKELSLVDAIKLLKKHPTSHAFSDDFNEHTDLFSTGTFIYYLNDSDKMFAPTQLDFSKDWTVVFY